MIGLTVCMVTIARTIFTTMLIFCTLKRILFYYIFSCFFFLLFSESQTFVLFFMLFTTVKICIEISYRKKFIIGYPYTMNNIQLGLMRFTMPTTVDDMRQLDTLTLPRLTNTLLTTHFLGSPLFGQPTPQTPALCRK